MLLTRYKSGRQVLGHAVTLATICGACSTLVSLHMLLACACQCEEGDLQMTGAPWGLQQIQSRMGRKGGGRKQARVMLGLWLTGAICGLCFHLLLCISERGPVGPITFAMYKISFGHHIKGFVGHVCSGMSAVAYASTPAVAYTMLSCLAMAKYICVVAPQCWHHGCVGMACTCIALILRSCSHCCKWSNAIGVHIFGAHKMCKLADALAWANVGGKCKADGSCNNVFGQVVAAGSLSTVLLSCSRALP